MAYTQLHMNATISCLSKCCLCNQMMGMGRDSERDRELERRRRESEIDGGWQQPSNILCSLPLLLPFTVIDGEPRKRNRNNPSFSFSFFSLTFLSLSKFFFHIFFSLPLHVSSSGHYPLTTFLISLCSLSLTLLLTRLHCLHPVTSASLSFLALSPLSLSPSVRRFSLHAYVKSCSPQRSTLPALGLTFTSCFVVITSCFSIVQFLHIFRLNP